MDYVLFIGLGGMLLLLVGFFLNIFKYIHQDSISYSLFNIFGSGLMIIYAILLNSLPFLILNIVWTGAALYKLYLIMRKHKYFF